VVGARRTGGNVPFFDQNGMNSPQRQIPSQSDAGDPAADDQNLGFQKDTPLPLKQETGHPSPQAMLE
jgi:hypothetical protein